MCVLFIASDGGSKFWLLTVIPGPCKAIGLCNSTFFFLFFISQFSFFVRFRFHFTYGFRWPFMIYMLTLAKLFQFRSETMRESLAMKIANNNSNNNKNHSQIVRIGIVCVKHCVYVSQTRPHLDGMKSNDFAFNMFEFENWKIAYKAPWK